MHRTAHNQLCPCMEKAAQGKDVTIAFLGGSITQGSLASSEEKTYARLVFSWWEAAFPDACLHYVNGGIGGTTSHFGVARVYEDILMYQPDFVIIDFSVNDQADQFHQETFEGLIRKILCHPSKPAILILNNVCYDTGDNAQKYHNRIGEWYGIPYVSIKDTLYQEIKRGIYTKEELTKDGLHPNDRGHELVAAEIIRFLESVKQEMPLQSAENMLPDVLPAPMTDNAYESSRRLTIREISPVLKGFYADTSEKRGHLDCFKNGWIGKNPGDRIIFEIAAAEIGVQYKKTIQRPAAKVELILDGEVQRCLDGNFAEDWGDCVYLEPILYHGERNVHTVELRVMEQAEKTVTPFVLLSLIIA